MVYTFNVTYMWYVYLQHGESMMNLQGRIGGDSDLSPRGLEVIPVLTHSYLYKHEFDNLNFKHYLIPSLSDCNISNSFISQNCLFLPDFV